MRNYVVLEVSALTYNEISTKLRDAAYDHAFHTAKCDHEEFIAIHGIALQSAPFPQDAVVDWAARAAQYLTNAEKVNEREIRLAAIIEAFAKPIIDLLRESRRRHRSTCALQDEDDDEAECNCDAEKWNKRIDEALL